jgi:hypothetical protein
MRVLKYLHVHLCNDVSLWSKLCRVLAHMVQTDKKQKAELKQQQQDGMDVKPNVSGDVLSSTIFEDVIADILLPAFSLFPASTHGASEELWSVLKPLPYEYRYRLYGYWESKVYEMTPELQQQKSSVLYRARYFRKRIAAAKVKECSRLILKFAENNPCWSSISCCNKSNPSIT